MALTTLLPVAGRTVHLPNAYPLQVMPATGVTVDLSTSTYWQRRVRDGDVTIASTTGTGTGTGGSGTGGSTGGTGGTGGQSAPSGSLAGVPPTATAGSAMTGVTYSLTNATGGAVYVLSGGAVYSSATVSGTSGGVPALALPATAGTATVQLKDTSGNVLYQTSINVTAASSGNTGGTGGTATPSGSLAGVPGSATAGTSLTGVSYALTNLSSATVAVVSGSTTVSSVSVSGASGTVPALALPSAAGSVGVQLKSGATVLWQTTVNVVAAGSGGGTTAPGGSLAGVPATAAAGSALSGVTYALTGTATGSVAILSGGVVQSSASVSGASGTVSSMTFPSAAGQVVVQLRDANGNALWQSTVTLAATGGTPTPGATITGPSAAATVGQLATFLVDLTGGLASAYVGLLSGNTPTGTRVAVTADGFVSIAMPSAAGSYAAGVFSAASGGTEYARTPVFAVSAANTGGTGTTAPAGKYVTGIAAAADGSGKLLAAYNDGTTGDITAAVVAAVEKNGLAVDAVDAVSIDFPTAVTGVIAAPLACTGSVNFRTADHHGRTLTFGAGGTLALAAPADATPGSWCNVLNTSTAATQVALGAGVVTAGGNTVAAAQSVRLTAAAGPDGVVRLYAATSLSNSAAAQTLSFAEAVPNVTAGNAFQVRLSYTNGSPTGLEWATVATGPWTVATGAAIADAPAGSGNGSASFLHPGLASSASAYNLRVRDRGHTDVVAVSNAFTSTAPASTGGATTPVTPTISVNTPGAQTAGAAFTVTGSYTGAAPTALDASINGGSTWQAVTATIGGGTFSFQMSISPAGTYAVRVRDRNSTAVSGASTTFAVAAAAGGTTPAYVGPLDAYTSTWTGLYSAARRLRSAYSGPALRVRRGDNVEQDIGFTAAGALDTAALTTFVGGGEGCVSKWYDQSGAGRHAAQTSAAYQPKIVVAGALQTLGGKPAIRFSNAALDQCLGVDALPAMTGASFLLMAAFQAVTLANYGRLAVIYKDGDPMGALFMLDGGRLQTRRWYAGGGESIADAYDLAAGRAYVADAEYNGATAAVHVSPAAGVTLSTSPYTEGFGAAGGTLGIGSALTGNADEAFDGLIAEFAVSHAPAAGERANLAASMRSAFGVAA